MQSSYKKIGEYIRLVDERNSDLDVTNLLGISVTKEFIPSVANIIGTDMSKYKIIRKNQFACSVMQVRRDKKMPVALYKADEPSIISQAYPIFEIIDTETLDPDYLMMWMSRSEFDRHACFLAVGGVRGSLEWEDFCDMPVPVPSIEKQREIVREYYVISDRIALNEATNRTLEATAQTIYKQWFVEFEFPDENGLPYRSTGGKMEFNEELDQEIPEGWEVKTVKAFCKAMKSGSTPNRSTLEYWDSKDIPWIKTGELKNSVLIDAEEYISKKGLAESSAKLLPINSVLVAMYGQGETKGQVGYLKKEAATNQACCSMICYNEADSTLLYYYLRVNRESIVSIAIGGAQPNLSKEIFENFLIVHPKKEVQQKHPFISILKSRENATRLNSQLRDFNNLLLSRMTLESKSV